ncbi:MAG: FecR family protein [Myxococcota bacterium]
MTPELERTLLKARAISAVEDDSSASRRALQRFHQVRVVRQRRRRLLGTMAAIGAAGLVAFLVVRGTGNAPTISQPQTAVVTAAESVRDPGQGEALGQKGPASASPQLIHFPDGSSATLLTSRTELRMESVSDSALELTMASGEARFDVAPNPDRLFRVRSAGLRIEVIGTSFTVRTDRHQTSVSVHEGRVAVHQADRHNILTEGMSLKLDHALGPEAKTPPSVESAPPPTAPPPPAEPRRARGRRRRPAHKAEARRDALSPEAKLAEIRRLLAAADVDRFRGEPEEAVRKLTQIVAQFATHPQAVPAAFMLGRVLRRELDAPRRAAEAFAQAYSLAPSGTLADDALANEIECWVEVGDQQQARARARVYSQRFPGGRNQDRVRRATRP